MNILSRQAVSRRRLAQAAANYTNLRTGDGSYTDSVETTDRLGRKVVVFITLNILSNE